MSRIAIPVPLGDLVDRITILEIKSQHIRDYDKLNHVRQELDLLTNTWLTSGHSRADIGGRRAQLKSINETLWDANERIRHKDAQGEFDETYIELARTMYVNNDQRAAIKREINVALDSEIVEEKSHPDYDRGEEA